MGVMRWITREQWDSLRGEGTDAHRLAGGRGEWLDRYGDWVVASVPAGADAPDIAALAREARVRFGFEPQGWLVKELTRDAGAQAPASLAAGEAPGTIVVSEAGVLYLVEPAAGYSAGLFTDQRLNRQWVRHLRARRMLNLFAYTCSFSVCAALTGAKTLNVDVSKRSLERGRENFRLNDLDPGDGHRFVAEDARKFAARLLRRGEMFDMIVLDPPTFGRGAGKVFRLGDHLAGMVRDCFGLLEPGGNMLVSCNYARWSASHLGAVCRDALQGRRFSIKPGEHPAEMSPGAVSCRIMRDANV